MTLRNPLVRVSGKIVELPSGDTLGGAPPGPSGLTWLGDWSSSTTYAANDAVVLDGTSYIAVAASINQTPPNSTYWAVLASAGADGATGPSGTGSGANFICNGRLTLTTNVAITTSDVTGATTVYFTPYNGNQISTYDSSTWTGHSFSEISIALGTLTSGKNYDVFIYNNSGTLTLEFSAAWSSDTARTDALALQDGVYVKSSDHSRRYLGTFRTTSTTQTQDSSTKRFLFNYYNRAQRWMKNATETTDSWSYSTAAYRQANNNTANQLDYVAGDSSVYVEAQVNGLASSSGFVDAGVGVGVNSTSTNSALAFGSSINTTFVQHCIATYRGYPGLGRNFIAWLETGAGASTQTWYGDKGGPTRVQAGISGSAWL